MAVSFCSSARGASTGRGPGRMAPRSAGVRRCAAVLPTVVAPTATRAATVSTRDDGTLRWRSSPTRTRLRTAPRRRTWPPSGPTRSSTRATSATSTCSTRSRAIAPLFAVRGNIDEHAPVAARRAHAGRRVAPRTLALRILLVHIGVNGPKLRADVARLAPAPRTRRWSYAGTRTSRSSGPDRGIAVFNPGSIGPRRFHLPIVFGTIDLTSTGVRLAHVDCETGEAWKPRRESGRARG